MKIVLNRIREENTFDLDYFNPKYYFETEWCLDMHGYLDREELEARIEEINRIVAANPLLSERAKKGLLFVFVLLSVTFGGLIAGFAAQQNGGYVAPSVIEAINVIAYFVGRHLVNQAAGRRSSQFSKAINILFDRYNVKDNPTANWKLKWRKVLTHYDVGMKHTSKKNSVKSKGKITPKYAEEAEIELEINDALAEITECTIRLHLYRNNKLRRITNQQEELERLLATNEDFLITIDDKKLPEIPFNYVQPSNNTHRPNNMPPFNNTPRPNNTPLFNNTPQPNNTPPFNNTHPPNNTEMSVISVRNTESLNANNNNRKMNNINDNENEKMNYANPQTNMVMVNSSIPYNPQMSSTYTGQNNNQN
ncbi:hypothetical protein RhiirA1_399805 [Rhizophagus irregularis]|uniref:Uncharacterized protein n=1 Tax=Rhizophagus irregularis TaxID=588596 RepID=A0A2I1EI61_9GLOM|nr:hypothetical protein RhiirA1_399805 [Rhizophagus irregularis]PKY21808.1 hypothetical protein RhiirB3_385953 [Rhizophagus irregularis]CAB5308744.1 unnamed protein product [Rhizophagus irregularis]